MSTSQRESTPQEMDTILETDHIEEIDHIQERVHVTKRSNKRAKSSVWDHFTKIKVGEGKYQDATCNHCGKKLAWSNAKGTSSMKKHIENNSCRKFNYNPYTSPRSQQVFDQDKSRRDFAVAVAKHNYPFNMSEHEYFGVYIKGSQKSLVKKLARNIPTWSINSKRLPILSMIARDILAVPATTVASESAFSLGGRIIDEERSQLGAEVVESLVTLNDWIPPINKTSRQSKPMIGEEVFESESDLEEFDDDSCED